MLITGGLFFSPARKDLKGTWLIESAQAECSSKVLRFQTQQGILKGTIDFPALKKYDQKLISVHTEEQNVEINLNDTDKIVGKWVNDSLITATYTTGSKHSIVELKKQ